MALCSRLIETSQLSDTVMDLATVGVYGCDYITANGVLYTYNNREDAPCGDVYHIGVGSNVVCSAVSGNAKASISGTDDRQFPRFFMLVLNLVHDMLDDGNRRQEKNVPLW